MACEYNDKQELIITLGPVAFAEIKTRLSRKKGYRYEMTDTEIKLNSGGVIRMAKQVKGARPVPPAGRILGEGEKP